MEPSNKSNKTQKYNHAWLDMFWEVLKIYLIGMFVIIYFS